MVNKLDIGKILQLQNPEQFKVTHNFILVRTLTSVDDIIGLKMTANALDLREENAGIGQVLIKGNSAFVSPFDGQVNFDLEVGDYIQYDLRFKKDTPILQAYSKKLGFNIYFIQDSHIMSTIAGSDLESVYGFKPYND